MKESIRERIEAQQATLLSPYAMQSAKSFGRDIPEEKDELRTDFQRDRDRIIHCNAFRRLKHKTQVFFSPERDHYRTRLTHTLEVSQIARTISRCLLLNEDLTEAIALGHDLGHTPFGHEGERALNECCPFGFKHYEQSVRVTQILEKNGRGLNLTKEVQDGMLRHTTGPMPRTLEGRVVRISDRIAYINHDIDDARRAGVMQESDIPVEISDVLGNRRSARIDTLVRTVVSQSTQDDIILSGEIGQAFERLHEYMFEHVYRNPVAKSQESKANGLVQSLYEYFVKNPDRLPDEYTRILKTQGADRAACDYIAGMTDRYAVEVYSDLFIPFSWR